MKATLITLLLASTAQAATLVGGNSVIISGGYSWGTSAVPWGLLYVRTVDDDLLGELNPQSAEVRLGTDQEGPFAPVPTMIRALVPSVYEPGRTNVYIRADATGYDPVRLHTGADVIYAQLWFERPSGDKWWFQSTTPFSSTAVPEPSANTMIFIIAAAGLLAYFIREWLL